MKKLLIPVLIFSISSSLSAAEGFSSLEEQMTGKEFKAAGLDKLTQQELDLLNAWIRSRSLATLSARSTTGVATAKDQRGLKTGNGEEDRTPITSRIVGRFSGWDGQTVFKLENGMIWEQTDKDKFYIKEVENPEVIIEPGIFDTWHLSVEGFDSDCRVERIQ